MNFDQQQVLVGSYLLTSSTEGRRDLLTVYKNITSSVFKADYFTFHVKIALLTG